MTPNFVVSVSVFLPICFHNESGMSYMCIFSSPEPNTLGELIGWDLSWRLSVCPFTLSDMNISETSWSIIIKFHRKHYWAGGLAALGFGPDQIRTMVYTATDSSHKIIMGMIL